MKKTIKIKDLKIGAGQKLVMIAGPCVIEGREVCLEIAERLVQLAEKNNFPLIFKASYDKANRTSLDSFRGPGLEKGLAILAEVRERFGVPILTDVHSVPEVAPAAEVVDVLQIPAFLCRQTDLLVAAGKSERVVNLKKGQFLAPEAMRHAVKKIESSGNRRIMLTERGSSFGHNSLVVDMRSLPTMAATGYPVVFDCTHSVQSPGGGGGITGGDRKMAPYLARAAVATGCDAIFMETHLDPERSKSDSANILPLDKLEELWKKLREIDEVL